jgi:KUP system potassium uptake protein
LVGALSIIIWSLTLIVTVKYCFIVLRADDDGEGGTFALYSLLARYAHIARRDPTISGTLQMRRHDTGDMKPAAKSVRSFIERSGFVKVLLQVIGVLGVSMIMAGTSRQS